MVEIKFVKVHEDAVLPCQAHSGELTGDTGYDLYAVGPAFIPAHGSGIVPVGIKVGYITPGYWFKVESRSGLSFKSNMLAHPGIIDNQYRGDMGVKVYNHGDKDYHFIKGDKISQIVVYKLIQAEISWIEQAQETERGENGFGSSDIKKTEVEKLEETLKKEDILQPKEDEKSPSSLGAPKHYKN